MPLYMDRHDFDGVTADDVASAHVRDLDLQERFGVRYLSYWFDYDRQAAFCLVEGPDEHAVDEVHRQAHGQVANRIIEVEPRRVEEFLGGIPQARPAQPYVETAFRAILFTDLEGSTALTQGLGDALALQVLRRHDRIVREALRLHGGVEVKHTGDGIMASFPSAVNALRCAIMAQRQIIEHSRAHPDEAITVRIGVAAGEPVTEDGDLFGAAVQLAARLCAQADPGSILVSGAVRDLSIGKSLAFGQRRTIALRGFSEPVDAYEVDWRASSP